MFILPLLIFILSIYAIPKANDLVKAPQIKTQSIYTSPEVKKINNFLKTRNSPLASASADFVIFGNQFKIPPDIMVGISKAESNFEKSGNTTDNNPFGFACFDGQACPRFRDYRTAIWHLAKTLGTKPAYAKFRETQRLEDLSASYLTGNRKRWQETIENVREELELE